MDSSAATATIDPPTPRKRINLRTPDIMATVQAQVESHYRSELVEMHPRARRHRFGGRPDRASGETIRLLLRR